MPLALPDLPTPAPNLPPTLQRRGLLAVAAAFVAGLVAKLSEQPVFAGIDGDLVLGAVNSTSGFTALVSTVPSGTALTLTGTAGTNGLGLGAVGSGYGVIGSQAGTGLAGLAGVLGQGRADGYGVKGQNFTGPGVFGSSDSSNGVVGESTTGIPMLGRVASGSSANTIAIYAQNYSTYRGPSPGAGGFAIYGLCANGHGLVGATATAGGAAVVGATNSVAGAYAGAFYGPVIVGGNFTVVGGAKSAAVPHPDGSHRRLYCMESPESWFEDFGKGQLDCGHATVAIDADFAAIVNVDDYHVFLTGYDGQSDLSVCDRTASGFRVRATSGAGNGAFSWRVVAKRRDIAGPRLETVTIPAEPTMPSVPDIPTPAPPPDPARLRRH